MFKSLSKLFDTHNILYINCQYQKFGKMDIVKGACIGNSEPYSLIGTMGLNIFEKSFRIERRSLEE